MLKTFPIDFIRQTLEQTLEEQHIASVNYFGGKDQVALTSFYEQLKSQEEVDRFVDNFRQLSEQQNRSGLIMNGVLVSPENPSITNLYSSLIIPMTFTCSNRVMLANRDQAIETINNLIEQLKGRKVDIAQLKCVDEINGGYCYKPFKVGTIGQNNGTPTLKNGDYLGELGENEKEDLRHIMNNLFGKVYLDYNFDTIMGYYYYLQSNSKLKCVKLKRQAKKDSYSGILSTTLIDNTSATATLYVNGLYERKDIESVKAKFKVYGATQEANISFKTGYITSVQQTSPTTQITATFSFGQDIRELINNEEVVSIEAYDEEIYIYEWSYEPYGEDAEDIIVPPEHISFEKYKLSLSFDAIRCDEPRNLNAEEYCELTYSGSATLVSEGVALGNDLLKIACRKVGIKAQTPITFTGATNYWLEPMEMPSGNNANTKINQLVSNNFLNNTHTDALSLSLQYTFIVDKTNDFLNQLFYYARYGTRGLTVNDISPNMIFNVREVWCSWGNYEQHDIKAKLVENVDIENTESDTLTIGLTLQIQGDND